MELELQEINNKDKDQQLQSLPPVADEFDQEDQSLFNPVTHPVDLTWENITYSVKISRKKKRILTNNLSGIARAGEMLAIMGPSGAGKTTLLNILAGRAHGGKLRGKILVNGEKLNGKQFKRVAGFVSQDDIMFPYMSVKETLAFSAFLRLPRAMSFSEKTARINDTIAKLGLGKCQHTRIGNEIVRGISGGERKRTNIGREIITDPSVIFLDEPTTGLDSFTALSLVKLLWRLAHNDKRTLVMTIHQPRSDIFFMFDNLLLLAQGEVAYSGPGAGATTYFAGIGYQCPAFVNPSDYFLDVITPDSRYPKRTEAKNKKIAGIIENWKDSKGAETEQLVKQHRTGGIPLPLPKARIPTQLFFLTIRQVSNTLRNVPFLIIRIFTVIFMALVIGLLYLQLDNDQESIRDSTGYLFFSVAFLTFQEVNSVIASFPLERAVFLHERSTGTYSVFSYFFSKITGDIPERLLNPIVYSNISYWMVGLPASRFGYFFLNCIFVTNVAASVGLFVGSISKSPEMGVALGTTLMIFSMVFGGFFVRQDNIPDYFIWIHYLSVFKYEFEIFIINNFRDRQLGCNPADSTPLDQCVDGNGVISNLGMEDAELYINFPSLLCFYLGFMTLTFLTLKFRRGE
eukprot:TRINITY_DN10629_c0_g1_i1.p1 TRINITY_DN10629_c0_g1~~TRINITY_DN10629_c0_g1_i1.p1  ORF type:complete len:629 (-),score=139.92 TRINITY_DN10629_c0_g1_i1:101-1987(-)